MEISTGPGTYVHTGDGATLARVARGVAMNEDTGEGVVFVRGYDFEAVLTVRAVSTND